MQTVYEAAGGHDGLLRLASAWHTRVLEDELVAHAFSYGFHPEHTERLATYRAEAFGGPTTYSDRYGDETSVVRIHSGNGLHEEMDQRAIACFDQALEDVGLARDERLRRVLHDYFAWATTTTMPRYHCSSTRLNLHNSPRPPQSRAATSKRLYRTRTELTCLPLLLRTHAHPIQR